VDGVGNVYVADTGNNTIRKITSTGVVTTLAGTVGIGGTIDGTGSSAQFNTPLGVTIDSAGNVYVTDINDYVRKITPAGVVTTLAYNRYWPYINSPPPIDEPYGIVPDGAGNLYVSNHNGFNIIKVTSAGVVSVFAGPHYIGGVSSYPISGITDGTGSVARFNAPQGIALDNSGNLYVADWGNHTIRKITSGAVVTTLAGTAGTPGSTNGNFTGGQFSYPDSVAVDGAGNVYTAESSAVRKITPAGVVTTIAGTAGSYGSTDGPGVIAQFDAIRGVAVDGAGNIYVADYGYDTIRKITPGGIVSTLAGTPNVQGSTDGTGSAALFSHPSGVAVDAAGNVYVADNANGTIRKITPAGVVTTLAGTAGSPGYADGTGAAARFLSPYGVAVDTAGNVYVADQNNDLIRKITPAGVVSTLAGTASYAGNADGTGSAAQFNHPASVSVDSYGNVYVADYNSNTIRKITSTGVVTTLAGTPGTSGSADGTGSAALFTSPYGVAVDGAGNLYVADSGNSTIRKGVPLTKVNVTLILSGLSATYDGKAKPVVVTQEGIVTTLAGSSGNAGALDGTGNAAQFSSPASVAVDLSGNLYVADTGNNTIRKITPAGVVTTMAGTAGSVGSTNGNLSSALFNAPAGVAVDGAGSIYVADTGNETIRRIVGGTVGPIAGAVGTAGSADGSGGNANFNHPTGLTVDSSGNIYVADAGNDTVRQITSAGMVTTFAGSTPPPFPHDDTVPFSNPNGVAVDGAGNLYVANTEDSLINKVTTADGITTFVGRDDGYALPAGGVAAWFTSPAGVALDSAGNLYVADRGNDTIRKITSGGLVVPIAGATGSIGSTDGNGSAARFNEPSGLTVDNAGSIYVADTGNNTIRKITAATGTISVTYNGSPTPPTAPGSYSVVATLNDPNYQATASGTLNILMRPGSDFNGDGKSDLLWTNASTGQRLLWLMNGTTFSSSVSLGNLSTDWQVAGTADFNGDGQTDILFQNKVTGERAIWLMNGTNYSSTVSLGSLSKDWQIAGTSDFNGDGQPDIVFQNTVTGERVIWLMNGTVYTSTVSLGTVSTDWQIVGTGDFNGDGQTDLVFQNIVTGERALWLMNGTAYSSTISLGFPSTTLQIAEIGDFNGDGKPDIVFQNTVTGERTVWLMNGTSVGSTVSLGVVSLDWTIGLPFTTTSVRADFNGDGKPDLVWENTSTGDRYVWLMNGTTFTSSVFVGNVGTAWHIAGTGDFNGDGKPDLVFENTTTGDRYIWLMNGTTFTSAVFLGNVGTAWHIAGTGDFNGDGQPDLVFENITTGDRYVWLMNGTTFTSAVFLGNVGTQWHIAGTGDFNGDGKPDLIFENTSTGDRYVWLMDGTTYRSSAYLGSLPTTWHIAGAGDFNADGLIDLIWENTTTGDRYFWLMNGTTFSSAVYLGNVPTQWHIRN
jgi:hypothetical protein